MRHRSTSSAWVLAAALALAGCKKAAPPLARLPTPIPTAVPDKDLLGFTRGGGIWVMRSDGSEQKLLAQAGRGQSLWFPVPAPGGDHLVAWLSRPDGTQDLAQVDLSGRVTVLTEIGARAKPLMKSLRLGNAPSYSPDGKRIAYSFNGDLWLMDANGYNAETFIADGNSWAPQFSPDGKHLAYVNGGSGHMDVWMADLDSRDTWQVTDFPDYTVGQPLWNKDGSGLLLTRSQGEDSDVVQVSLGKELGNSAPVSDADPLTKDRVSGGAVWDPSGLHLLFTSAREGGTVWNLYSADALGGSAKLLTHEGAFSPFWMRPTMQAAIVDLAPSRPTPVLAKPAAVPTAMAEAPKAPALPAPGAPAAVPTRVAASPAASAPVTSALPAKTTPTSASTPGAAKPSAPAPVASAPGSATKPGLPQRPAPSASVPANQPQVSTAPTQPPAKAAPLRLRFKASFASDGTLAPAGLAELKKLAPRVAQYASETVTVIGPMDRSGLKGKYASEEARSLARAKAIATELTKEGKLKPGSAKALPYSPPAAGASGPSNSIQVYVELK